MKFSKPVQESTDDFDIEALLENWPDSYYEERDPVNRRRLLDAADEAGLTPEDNAVRRNLYKKRYGRERRGIVQDNYLRMWMDFTFFVRNGNPKRSLRRDQAKIRKILKDTGFAEYAQADERAQQLLYRELYHLAMLYISVCAEDKGYNAVLLGFGHISNDRLIEKIEICSRPTLRGKLMAYLRILQEKQHSDYVVSPLTRTALAEYLCSNRSAMTRELAAMRNDGLIDYDGSCYRILR